jgi:Family of unknown function (DUF6077)
VVGLWLPVIAIGSGLLAATLAAWNWGVPWTLVWLPALIAVVIAVTAGKLHSGTAASAETRSWTADAFAAGLSLLFAVMSLLVLRTNPDDVFYVNRATATAQLNHIPVLDVIFTHEEAARGGGAGLPVDSYSALQGAVARFLGLHAASVAYLIFPPVFTFLAAWALWRLVRAWAPRRAWLCFALGAVFLSWSAQTHLTSGNFFLTRIWQGKVAFVAWLIPTIYVYLTQWLGKRDALTGVLILTAGLACIGATGSATFVAPAIFASAVVALAVRMDWRALTVPLAAAAIPFGIGIFVLSRFPLSQRIGRDELQPESWFYFEVVGMGVVAVVAAFGIWGAPWIARSGPAAWLTTGLAVVVTIIIAPGAIGLLSDLSGLTGTLRRMLWIVPFPALVGLLAALPVASASRIGRLVPIAVPTLIAILLVALGTPLWGFRGHTLWHYPPSWKTYRASEVRAILRSYHGDGPILADRGLMGAIPLVTVEPKAVNARSLYLVRTALPRKQIKERLVLTRFISGDEPRPKTAAVRRALANLRVGLVCIRQNRRDFIPIIERVGPFREAFTTRRGVCLERTPSSSG